MVWFSATLTLIKVRQHQLIIKGAKLYNEPQRQMDKELECPLYSVKVLNPKYKIGQCAKNLLNESLKWWVLPEVWLLDSGHGEPLVENAGGHNETLEK